MGVMMYVLLTGQYPPSALERLGSAIGQTPPLFPPSQLNRKISPQLEQVIVKAMALQPSQRYPNALEMLNALNRLPEAKKVKVPTPRAQASSSQLSLSALLAFVCAVASIALTLTPYGGGGYLTISMIAGITLGLVGLLRIGASKGGLKGGALAWIGLLVNLGLLALSIFG
jgi:hypothetical protein